MASAITITRRMSSGRYAELLDACTHYNDTMGWSAAVTLKNMAEDSELFRNWKKQKAREDAKKNAATDRPRGDSKAKW